MFLPKRSDTYNINLLCGSDFFLDDRFGFPDKRNGYYGLSAHSVSQEIDSHGLNCNLQPFMKKKEAVRCNISGSLHFLVCMKTDFIILYVL